MEDLCLIECEILVLICAGSSNKAIAHWLGLSQNEVKYRISRIYENLEASSRIDIVKKGLK